MKRKVILSISFIGLLITSLVFDYDKNIDTNKLKSPREIVVGYHGKQYSDDAVYKVNKNEKNKFLFCLGNSNTMMYITNIKNHKNNIVTVELYIENNTDKEILASANLIYQQDSKDNRGTIIKGNDNNEFRITNKGIDTKEIEFNVPSNIDFKNLRINILSETIDGNPLTDVTGNLNCTEL